MRKKVVFLIVIIAFFKASMAQAVYPLSKKYQTFLVNSHLWYSGYPVELSQNHMKRILLVCGGNTGRSPMAESLANDYFYFPQSGYEAFSRGVNVNSHEIMPEKNAVTVMYEWSASSHIRAHRATSVTMDDINKASIVLAMTKAQQEKLLLLNPHAAHKIWTLSQCADGSMQDVSDMYGHDLVFYQQTSKKIAYYLQLIKEHGFSCQGQS